MPESIEGSILAGTADTLEVIRFIEDGARQQIPLAVEAEKRLKEMRYGDGIEHAKKALEFAQEIVMGSRS